MGARQSDRARASAGGDLGGTMRLGAYPAVLARAAWCARSTAAPPGSSERHRHRYEVNVQLPGRWRRPGCGSPACRPTACCRRSSNPGHPWFIGVQFHPGAEVEAVRAASAVRRFHRRGARAGAAPDGPAVAGGVARDAERHRAQPEPEHDAMFQEFPIEYYWSTYQSEWATDICSATATLARLYPKLVHHGLTTFLSPDVMRFLGRKIPRRRQAAVATAGRVVSDMKRRPEGRADQAPQSARTRSRCTTSRAACLRRSRLRTTINDWVKPSCP
jgi:hypothetical protein